jgi:hypothetical protein
MRGCFSVSQSLCMQSSAIRLSEIPIPPWERMRARTGIRSHTPSLSLSLSLSLTHTHTHTHTHRLPLSHSHTHSLSLLPSLCVLWIYFSCFLRSMDTHPVMPIFCLSMDLCVHVIHTSFVCFCMLDLYLHSQLTKSRPQCIDLQKYPYLYIDLYLVSGRSSARRELPVTGSSSIGKEVVVIGVRVCVFEFVHLICIHMLQRTKNYCLYVLSTTWR